MNGEVIGNDEVKVGDSITEEADKGSKVSRLVHGATNDKMGEEQGD